MTLIMDLITILLVLPPAVLSTAQLIDRFRDRR